jgi:hypothetical protein
MADFITNGATELPAVGDDGKVRSANNWTVGDTYDIQQALLELRTAVIALQAIVAAPALRGYDDREGPIAVAGGLAALTLESYGDTDFPAYHFRHDQDDKLFFTIQTSHRWDTTTPLYFHLHCTPMADVATPKVIRVSGTYAWFRYGVQTPLAADWTPYAVSHTVNPGDLRVPTIISLLTATPPEGTKESDFLMIRVIRPGSSDALDTFTESKPSAGTAAANLALGSGDAHFLSVKAGTVTEIPT